MQLVRDVWEWLKSALAAVYQKDGLVGIAAIVALVLAVYLVLWWTGADVLGFVR